MTEENFSSEPLRRWSRVDAPAAARLLTDPDELRLLEPFVHASLTVKEAAAALNIRLDALYFRVRRAERLGLLRVASVEPRSGRPVKRYSSVAAGFFVPYSAAPFESFEALALGYDLRLERLLVRNVIAASHADSLAPDFGVRIYRDDEGHLTVDAAFGPEEPYDFTAPSNPATYSAWRELSLDFHDAKVLQAELDALASRYRGKKGAGRYLLRLGLAPLLTP